MTPTQRTLRWLRDQSYAAEVVERWIPRARRGEAESRSGVRRDLFGFADIVALRRDAGIVAVQCFSTAWTQHVAKMTDPRSEVSAMVIEWLAAGGACYIVGWRRLKLRRNSKAVRIVPRWGMLTLDASGSRVIVREGSAPPE